MGDTGNCERACSRCGGHLRVKCAACHGKDGRRLPNWKGKGQPDFSDAKWQRPRTDEQIADAIRDGKGKFMPAWKGKLSEDDVNGMVGRVRAFGKKLNLGQRAGFVY
jgi:mono/diheme cytochrome c family protein